jgi:hypothetical protein
MVSPGLNASASQESTNHMATKVWFNSPVHLNSKGSKSSQILVRSSHRSAMSNSAVKGRWTTGDVSLFGFTLSLVLLGTILSAYTDRPIFWLLVGPGPIAVGFTLISFYRHGNQKNWLTSLRQRTGRLVYRHGTHRSLIPSKRSSSRVRRERHLRAECSNSVAYPSAGSDPDCHCRLRVGSARGRSY